MARLIFILRFLLAVVHLDLGAFTLLGFHSEVQPFGELNLAPWISCGLGFAEIASGLFLLDGRLLLFGASALTAIMSATLVTSLAAFGHFPHSAAYLLALNGFVAWHSGRGSRFCRRHQGSVAPV